MTPPFLGPCVHGRDPWTRCDVCETEDQARGLEPPTAKQEHAMTIKEWSTKVHALAVEKGWWPSPTLTPDEILSRLMLVVSELAEAAEAVRSGEMETYLVYSGDGGKPEGFGIELSDALIRILDLAGGMGVDLEACMELKHAYNQTRPHRHGRVV